MSRSRTVLTGREVAALRVLALTERTSEAEIKRRALREYIVRELEAKPMLGAAVDEVAAAERRLQQAENVIPLRRWGRR